MHRSRWSILPHGRFESLQTFDGQDPNIDGRKGIVTDLNGVYFIELLGPGRLPGTVRFRNAPSEGRHEVTNRTDEIESELIYPLIKGAKEISAFNATTSQLFVIIPNKRITYGDIPTVTALAHNYPGALRYFRAMNHDHRLDRRSTWKTRMKQQYDRRVSRGELDPSEIPFYAIYDVGDYTFAPYKVVWAEMAGSLQAAVIANANVPFGGGIKPIVPDHKVYFAPFEDPLQAHYVCALLNSEPVRTFIDSFTVKIQVGSLFRCLILPRYDPSAPDAMSLAHYSLRIRSAYKAGQSAESVKGSISAIDAIAGRLIMHKD